MRLHGASWLRAAIQRPIETIVQSELPLEVDPFKLGAGDDLATNQQNLGRLADELIEWIYASVSHAKPAVREVARKLSVCDDHPAESTGSDEWWIYSSFLCSSDFGWHQISHRSPFVGGRFFVFALPLSSNLGS